MHDVGACIVGVGAVFVCAKVLPTVGNGVGVVLGVVRYPVRGEFDRVVRSTQPGADPWLEV